MAKYLRVILLVGIISAGLVWLLVPRSKQEAQAQLTGLSAPAGDFQQADGSYRLSFPADFGPHNNYQSEWWYYTGNLTAADGRHFGYELTFFRRAVLAADQRTPRSSDFAFDQIYMAHFTMTDVAGKQFHYSERFSRGSAGLAGAATNPVYQVWLEDWSVEAVGENRYHLRANGDGLALDLTLTDPIGPVLQGVNGYSQKGPEPGNASYYYSQPRLESSGTVQTGGETMAVQGLSWMDHEFSTSALGTDLVGWDWFSIQLSDGSELMLYNLRRKDGSIDRFSSGTYIRKDGSTKPLQFTGFKITAAGTWRSPHSGAVYPSGWRLEVPSEGIDLQIEPFLADQELNVSFVYWEGAVSVKGEHAGANVTGQGYVELTGYARSMQGQL
jgi:predicted secreted hydrolase